MFPTMFTSFTNKMYKKMITYKVGNTALTSHLPLCTTIFLDYIHAYNAASETVFQILAESQITLPYVMNTKTLIGKYICQNE